MRARGWLLAALLGVGAGVPAHAAGGPEPAVVARDGNVELVAEDRADELCLTVRNTAALGAPSACDEPQPGVATPASSPLDGPQLVGVAAPADATSVEVRRLGKIVGSGATVAGEAYRGTAAGSLRFALVRLAPGTRESGLRVHAKDATGTLVAVLDSGGERLIDSRRLLAGRSGRVRWSVHLSHRSVLDPTVADLARERVAQCVTYDVDVLDARGRDPGALSGDTGCASGRLIEDFVLDSDFVKAREEDRCAPSFRLMHGEIPASVRRVTVLLGDGRRRVAPMAALGDGISRVWALAVARGDAVRSVTLESAGTASHIVPRRLAPVAVGCAVRDDNSVFTDFSFSLAGDGLPPVTTSGTAGMLAGPPAVRIADGPRDTLCLALGDAPFTAAGCELVVPSFSRLLTVSDDPSDPHAIVYAVPARVATVRLSSADGKTTLDIPAVEAQGYAGRYAGHVRIAAATVSRWYDLPLFELLDAAGKRLYREVQSRAKPADVERQVFAPRRIAGRIAAPSLWQTRRRFGGETSRCLALTAGPPPPAADACEVDRSSETVLLDASCTTHRLTVAVAVAPGTRVRLLAGTAAPRRLALRDGAGLETLRPGSSLRALDFVRSGRARRVRLDAPPGVRQCGWAASPDVEAR